MLHGARDDVDRALVGPHVAPVELDEHGERALDGALVRLLHGAEQEGLQLAIHSVLPLLGVDAANVRDDVPEEQRAQVLVAQTEHAEEEWQRLRGLQPALVAEQDDGLRQRAPQLGFHGTGMLVEHAHELLRQRAQLSGVRARAVGHERGELSQLGVRR